MKKQVSFLSLLTVLLVTLLIGSCKKEPDIGSYDDPKPTSVYNLRRVQLKEGLVFGKTAIPAIVTSDAAGRNVDSRILVVQDPTSEAAIVIQFAEKPTNFKLNDRVTINLEGAQITQKDGELIISGISQDQIASAGEKGTVTPKSTTIAGLLANAKYWGPILVKLDKVNIASNSQLKLTGNLTIDDDIAEMTATFDGNSVFASETNPGFVESFNGLPLIAGNEVRFYPRNLEDIKVGVSELLEDFEQGSNTNYDAKPMNFITGIWTIDGGITATSSSDPKNGKQSIRLQGTVGNANRTGIIAMNFDLKGVKTVSVSHGIYPAAAEVGNVNPTVFTLEVSRDGGVTYQELGSAEVDLKSTSLKASTFTVNAGLGEKVRFRVVNTSIPFSNNNRPRINIDDILFKF